MYEIIKSVIESGQYELNDMLKKINTIWVQSDITDEEKTELITLAQNKANPENSYAPLQNQINDLYDKVKALTLLVDANSKEISAIKSAIENLGGSVDPEPEPEPEPSDEYPDWYAWPGYGPIPWNNGSKCSHIGERWISHVDNNIWEPGAVGVYDSIWEKLIEGSEGSEPVGEESSDTGGESNE